MTTKEIEIKGSLNSVYFQDTARLKAEELGITGTISENADGSRTIISTGEAKPLAHFIDWFKKGSLSPMIDSVEERVVAFKNYRGFSLA